MNWSLPFTSRSHRDLAKEETWHEIVVKSGIIVDTVMDMSGGQLDLEPNKKLVTVKIFLAFFLPVTNQRGHVQVALNASLESKRPKTVIYTSGLGVIGDRPGEVVDENTRVLRSSPRAEFEDWLLAQQGYSLPRLLPASLMRREAFSVPS